MKPKFLRACLIGSVFGSCTLGLIPPAAAQSTTASTPATQGLATITVVARKKTENLQKVPLSVTAITAKTLKQSHVEDLHDIAAFTPGVTVTDIGAEAGTSITIRGETDETFGANIGDVATFLDGTYLREPNAINVAAIPLADVEVVKAPVSALYGRDAYSGVINYVAQRPTETPHADISETAGDYGKSELAGDISGPLYGDKVLGEVFGDYDTFAGTYHDKAYGVNVDAGGHQKKDFGGLLDFHWSDNFTTQLDYYYGYDYFNNTATEALTPNCGPAYQPTLSGTLAFSNSLYCGTVKTNGTVDTGFDSGGDHAGNARRTFYGSMKNTGTFNWGTIDSITGASQIDEQSFQQFDPTSIGEPFLLANGTSPSAPPNGGVILKHDYYGAASQTGNVSEELRFNSPQAQPIRYGAGGFFYSESRIEESAASISTAGIPAGQELWSVYGPFFPISLFETPTGAIGNPNKDIHVTDEEAAFANAEVDLLPNLTISSEYRYSWLLQKFSPILLDSVPGVTYPEGSFGNLTTANQYFSSNEAIRWLPVPTETLYFAFANGVKPGGFNGASTVAADESYGPESDLSYEGGAKSSLFENRLQLNVAVYHIDTQNVQGYAPSSDPHNPATLIKNFGQTANTGFEVDARALPVDGLTLSSGFSYNDPTFAKGSLDLLDTSYCALIPSCAKTEVTLPSGAKAIPIGGNITPFTSKFTLSASAEYDYLLAQQYPAYARVNYAYKSSEYNDPDLLTSIGSSSNLDFFTGVSKGRYTLSAYVKNITNNQTPVDVDYEVQLSAFQNVPVAILPPGRTFAFTVAAKF